MCATLSSARLARCLEAATSDRRTLGTCARLTIASYFFPRASSPTFCSIWCRRYDPVTHVLLIDRKSSVPPGYHDPPLALTVGERGRLHAVLASNDDEVLEKAFQSGVPRFEPATELHEHHRRNVARPEKIGRYDPISSSLAFRKSDGTDLNIHVGDNGRLRSLLESGAVDSQEARDMGLPPPETYRGKASRHGDPGHFNPLTHQYSVNSTPRDTSKAMGRRPLREPMRHTLTPRINPLTHKLDPLNTASTAFRLYRPELKVHQNLRIIPRHIPALDVNTYTSQVSGSQSARM